MNRADAAQVLAILAAPHGFTIEPDTMEVWYQAALERIDADEATAVAVRCVETDERFPTPARFNTVRDVLRRELYEAERQAAAEAEGRLLPPVAPVASHVQQEIAALRTTIGTAESRGHWHGGPNGCPICGGIAPDAYMRLPQSQRDAVDMNLAQIKARHR